LRTGISEVFEGIVPAEPFQILLSHSGLVPFGN